MQGSSYISEFDPTLSVIVRLVRSKFQHAHKSKPLTADGKPQGRCCNEREGELIMCLSDRRSSMTVETMLAIRHQAE